jgi:hypothetical protein
VLAKFTRGGAENATSLHRNSDVAPKKLEQCSFALDIK